MEHHNQSSSENWACNPSPRKRMIQLLVRLVGKTPCRWLGRVGEFPILIVFCCHGGSMNWNLGGAWAFPSKGGWNWPQKLQCNPTTLTCNCSRGNVHKLRMFWHTHYRWICEFESSASLPGCCLGFASWTSRSQELGSFCESWMFFNMQGNITKAFWQMPGVWLRRIGWIWYEEFDWLRL